MLLQTLLDFQVVMLALWGSLAIVAKGLLMRSHGLRSRKSFLLLVVLVPLTGVVCGAIFLATVWKGDSVGDAVWVFGPLVQLFAALGCNQLLLHFLDAWEGRSELSVAALLATDAICGFVAFVAYRIFA